jgi:hypothetical protein
VGQNPDRNAGKQFGLPVPMLPMEEKGFYGFAICERAMCFTKCLLAVLCRLFLTTLGQALSSRLFSRATVRRRGSPMIFSGVFISEAQTKRHISMSRLSTRRVRVEGNAVYWTQAGKVSSAPLN